MITIGLLFALRKETRSKFVARTTTRCNDDDDGDDDAETMTMIPKHRPPTHAGEILLEEFLKPLNLTQVEAAEKMGISSNRLNELIRGKRGVTADTALRLAKLLKTTPEFWLNLQNAYDLYEAKHVMSA
jgi:addiction module HigA family antidote